MMMPTPMTLTASTSAATQAMLQGLTPASAASVTTGSCTTLEEKTSMAVSKTVENLEVGWIENKHTSRDLRRCTISTATMCIRYKILTSEGACLILDSLSERK